MQSVPIHWLARNLPAEKISLTVQNVSVNFLPKGVPAVRSLSLDKEGPDLSPLRADIGTPSALCAPFASSPWQAKALLQTERT